MVFWLYLMPLPSFKTASFVFLKWLTNRLSRKSLAVYYDELFADCMSWFYRNVEFPCLDSCAIWVMAFKFSVLKIFAFEGV